MLLVCDLTMHVICITNETYVTPFNAVMVLKSVADILCLTLRTDADGLMLNTVS